MYGFKLSGLNELTSLAANDLAHFIEDDIANYSGTYGNLRSFLRGTNLNITGNEFICDEDTVAVSNGEYNALNSSPKQLRTLPGSDDLHFLICATVKLIAAGTGSTSQYMYLTHGGTRFTNQQYVEGLGGADYYFNFYPISTTITGYSESPIYLETAADLVDFTGTLSVKLFFAPIELLVSV